jgi:phosphonate utilization associated putative membrane protein
MPTLAILALGASVLMHVAWNLLARHSPPGSRFLWWGLAAHLLIFGPWSLYQLVTRADWSGRLAQLLLITAATNGLYFIALARAYHYAPVALVYPIVRSSPVLIALWGMALFGENLSPTGWAGILLSVAGVLWLGNTAEHGDARHALPWAAVAALCTSVYSLSDKAAVAALPTLGTQLGFVTASYAVSFTVLSLQNRRATGRWRPAVAPPLKYWLPGGLFIGTAYAMVIHAMQYIPAAYAVAFTNAGILLAGLLSMTVFGERARWRARLFAIALAAGGLAILAAA